MAQPARQQADRPKVSCLFFEGTKIWTKTDATDSKHTIRTEKQWRTTTMESTDQQQVGKRPRTASGGIELHPIRECQQKWEAQLRLTRSKATLERYSRALNRFRRAFPRHTDVNSFLRPDINSWVQDRLAEGASVATVRTELAAVRAFFQFCERIKYSLLNPARGVRVPNRIRTRRAPQTEHISLMRT